MTTLLKVDAEECAKQWAKGLQLGRATGKVFYGKPKGQNLPAAWVEVMEVNSTDAREMFAVGTAHIQWDVYVRGARKRECRSIVNALELQVKLLHTGSRFGEAAAVIGTEITLGPLWRPEDDAELARYLLETAIELRPRVAA